MAAGHTGKMVHQIISLLDELSPFTHKQFPGRRQMDRPRIPHKQRRSNFFLCLPNSLTQRGLADIEALRRAGEAAFFQNRQHILNGFECHGRPPMFHKLKL